MEKQWAASLPLQAGSFYCRKLKFGYSSIQNFDRQQHVSAMHMFQWTQFWPYYWKRRYTDRSTDWTISGFIPGRAKYFSLLHGIQNFMVFVLPAGSFSPKAVKAKNVFRNTTGIFGTLLKSVISVQCLTLLNTGIEGRNRVSYWVRILERNLYPEERGHSEIFLRLGDPKVNSETLSRTGPLSLPPFSLQICLSPTVLLFNAV